VRVERRTMSVEVKMRFWNFSTHVTDSANAQSDDLPCLESMSSTHEKTCDDGDTTETHVLNVVEVWYPSKEWSVRNLERVEWASLQFQLRSLMSVTI